MKNDCTRARDLIAAEPDGDLGAAQVIELRHHLALCAGCRGERAGLQRSVAVLEALPQREPHPDFVGATLRAARLARQAQQSRQGRWIVFGSVAALALGAAALAGVRVSGLWDSLAQWVLESAPGVVRLGDNLALAGHGVYDSLAPAVSGLLLALTNALVPLLTLLARAGRSMWSSAAPGYVLAIATLAVIVALSRPAALARPVQVEKML